MSVAFSRVLTHREYARFHQGLRAKRREPATHTLVADSTLFAARFLLLAFCCCSLRLLLASLAGSHAHLHQGLRAKRREPATHTLVADSTLFAARFLLLLSSLATRFARWLACLFSSRLASEASRASNTYTRFADSTLFAARFLLLLSSLAARFARWLACSSSSRLASEASRAATHTLVADSTLFAARFLLLSSLAARFARWLAHAHLHQNSLAHLLPHFGLRYLG